MTDPARGPLPEMGLEHDEPSREPRAKAIGHEGIEEEAAGPQVVVRARPRQQVRPAGETVRGNDVMELQVDALLTIPLILRLFVVHPFCIDGADEMRRAMIVESQQPGLVQRDDLLVRASTLHRKMRADPAIRSDGHHAAIECRAREDCQRPVDMGYVEDPVGALAAIRPGHVDLVHGRHRPDPGALAMPRPNHRGDRLRGDERLEGAARFGIELVRPPMGGRRASWALRLDPSSNQRQPCEIRLPVETTHENRSPGHHPGEQRGARPPGGREHERQQQNRMLQPSPPAVGPTGIAALEGLLTAQPMRQILRNPGQRQRSEQPAEAHRTPKPRCNQNGQGQRRPPPDARRNQADQHHRDHERQTGRRQARDLRPDREQRPERERCRPEVDRHVQRLRVTAQEARLDPLPATFRASRRRAHDGQAPNEARSQ